MNSIIEQELEQRIVALEQQVEDLNNKVQQLLLKHEVYGGRGNGNIAPRNPRNQFP